VRKGWVLQGAAPLSEVCSDAQLPLLAVIVCQITSGNLFLKLPGKKVLAVQNLFLFLPEETRQLSPGVCK